jgi:cholesterol oxidase
MAVDFDVVIVGSGFGGAVNAFRLAKAGAKVLVLERGRRWNPTNFPRQPTDPWLWDDRRVEQRHGWFDFRVFNNMSVVQGAGVGGGSLVYANISVDAKPDSFDSGWPPEITFAMMQDQYAKVTHMLELKAVPEDQWPERTKLLKLAAERAGFKSKFRPLDLAVRFDEAWSYDLPDKHNHAHSKERINVVGVKQGTCVHLGNCDIGCDVNARNTLDLNYLKGAEDDGAEIRPYHLARKIAPIAGGYEIDYDEIVEGATTSLRPGKVSGRIAIIAAGSLGSTELLLRSRAALPNISSRLGFGWSSNGDFLTPAIHALWRPRPNEAGVDPTHGPTITAAIDLLGGEFRDQPIFVEDGGLPDVARNWLQQLANQQASDDPQKDQVIKSLLPIFGSGFIVRQIMPWFAQARDAADGRLSLKNGHLHLDWNINASRPTMNAVVAIHQRLAVLTAGMPLTPLTWTFGENLITPHPLGGCNMGTTADVGVVNHAGEVFNYPNLFVADGAVVPEALGLNPSKTIAALAEYIAEGITTRV